MKLAIHARNPLLPQIYLVHISVNGWVDSLAIVWLEGIVTTWFLSASILYRPCDRRLSAKLMPTYADRGCHVVSTNDMEKKYNVLSSYKTGISSNWTTMPTKYNTTLWPVPLSLFGTLPDLETQSRMCTWCIYVRCMAISGPVGSVHSYSLRKPRLVACSCFS
jgi:hypothetical protein